MVCPAMVTVSGVGPGARPAACSAGPRPVEFGVRNCWITAARFWRLMDARSARGTSASCSSMTGTPGHRLARGAAAVAEAVGRVLGRSEARPLDAGDGELGERAVGEGDVRHQHGVDEPRHAVAAADRDLGPAAVVVAGVAVDPPGELGHRRPDLGLEERVRRVVGHERRRRARAPQPHRERVGDRVPLLHELVCLEDEDVAPAEHDADPVVDRAVRKTREIGHGYMLTRLTTGAAA